jgi:hypothetical protein
MGSGYGGEWGTAERVCRINALQSEIFEEHIVILLFPSNGKIRRKQSVFIPCLH